MLPILLWYHPVPESPTISHILHCLHRLPWSSDTADASAARSSPASYPALWNAYHPTPGTARRHLHSRRQRMYILRIHFEYRTASALLSGLWQAPWPWAALHPPGLHRSVSAGAPQAPAGSCPGLALFSAACPALLSAYPDTSRFDRNKWRYGMTHRQLPAPFSHFPARNCQEYPPACEILLLSAVSASDQSISAVRRSRIPFPARYWLSAAPGDWFSWSHCTTASLHSPDQKNLFLWRILRLSFHILRCQAWKLSFLPPPARFPLLWRTLHKIHRSPSGSGLPYMHRSSGSLLHRPAPPSYSS